MKLPAFWLCSFGTCHCSVQNVLGKWPSLYAISILNSQMQKATAQPESLFVLCSELRCLAYARKKEKANYLQTRIHWTMELFLKCCPVVCISGRAGGGWAAGPPWWARSHSCGGPASEIPAMKQKYRALLALHVCGDEVTPSPGLHCVVLHFNSRAGANSIWAVPECEVGHHVCCGTFISLPRSRSRSHGQLPLGLGSPASLGFWP